ncbi:Itaconate transport protein [Lachnellula hyalina]|uniref:Itaconate transport protein n=1 Tax=Lachnellula hyalina TaxID=1316788 RepID=A0A8H8R983_9HELO|nr:Itaconate transport protein [Lachnellula hyalina]TVY30965.1 Itaconate transport protein [Lachnellula hyalina]
MESTPSVSPLTPTPGTSNFPAVPRPALKSRPSTKRNSSWLTTKLSRNSSMTSKSQSIPILVHIGDLLKPPPTTLQLPPDQEVDEGFPKASSERMQSDLGAGRTSSPSLSRSETLAHSTSVIGLGGSRDSVLEDLEGKLDPEEQTKSIYSLVPEPPADPFEHFDKWFPKSPQEEIHMEGRQKAFVDKTLPQPPYHVFDHSKKFQIVVLVSLAGILSPISTSIYLPALTAIASEFNISSAVVLLTVTVFMVFHAIAPFFWMPICSTLGRRPTFVLTLTVFVGSNIGLVYSRSFAALMVLRAVQAIGSAALTAICAAVIGDISNSKERARFIGLFAGTLMFTFIGPFLGGILTHWMGFRSIFWFLFASGSVVLILIIMMLPETLRSIAGNGTIRLKPIQQPLIHIFRSSSDTPFDSDLASFCVRTKSLSMDSILEPFHCLLQKDVLVTAIVGSVVFAICTTVITTTTTMFEQHYHISAFTIGLAFLPAGAGSVISFFLTGYLMDHDMRVVENKYRNMYDLEKNTPLAHKTLPDFPLERARLRNLWWIALIFIGTTAGYGISFSAPTIAAPLILQFFIATSATALLLLNGVLVSDLYSGNASVTLAVNLVRFSTGALAVGTVQLALDRIGNAFTFLALALVMLGITPIMIVQWVFGRPWQARRNSSWPRRKLSAEITLPVTALMDRCLAFIRSRRLPDLRAMSVETVDSVRSRSRNMSRNSSKWG